MLSAKVTTLAPESLQTNPVNDESEDLNWSGAFIQLYKEWNGKLFTHRVGISMRQLLQVCIRSPFLPNVLLKTASFLFHCYLSAKLLSFHCTNVKQL